MSKICPIPPLGFDDSSIDEQFDFVRSHRVLIAATSEQVPLAEWHQKIIRERLAVYHASPSAGRCWTDVRIDIERKLHDR